MRNPIIILAGAAVVGLIGGALFPRDGAPSSTSTVAASGWTPRNTIKREVVTSAEDLDGQQPDAAAFIRPSPRPVQAASASAWSYRNCREARVAGAAPIYRGQPGYGTHMDGDNDGIACEPY